MSLTVKNGMESHNEDGAIFQLFLSALWYQEEESDSRTLMCLGYHLTAAFPYETNRWPGLGIRL